MADPADSMDSLIQLSEYGLFDTIIHYALLLGAIFQLVCILAVIVVPPRERDEWPGDQVEIDEGRPLVAEVEGEKKPVKSTTDLQAPVGRNRKSDNKKRR